MTQLSLWELWEGWATGFQPDHRAFEGPRGPQAAHDRQPGLLIPPVSHAHKSAGEVVTMQILIQQVQGGT